MRSKKIECPYCQKTNFLLREGKPSTPCPSCSLRWIGIYNAETLQLEAHVFKEHKILPEEILELMRNKMNAEYEYINPHFLQSITKSIYDYYKLEDEEVDEWIVGMFGA